MLPPSNAHQAGSSSSTPRRPIISTPRQQAAAVNRTPRAPKPGEVWWARLSIREALLDASPNKREGIPFHGDYKTRPCLVLFEDGAKIVVAPITSLDGVPLDSKPKGVFGMTTTRAVCYPIPPTLRHGFDVPGSALRKGVRQHAPIPNWFHCSTGPTQWYPQYLLLGELLRYHLCLRIMISTNNDTRRSLLDSK